MPIRPNAKTPETAIEIETGEVGDAAGGKQCHGRQVDRLVGIARTPRGDCDITEESGAARSEGGHKVKKDSVVADDDGLAVENWDGFGVDDFGNGEDDRHERLGLLLLLFSVGVVGTLIDVADIVPCVENAASLPLQVAPRDPPVQPFSVCDVNWFIIRETLFVDSISQLGREFHKREDLALRKRLCGFARHCLLQVVSI